MKYNTVIIRYIIRLNDNYPSNKMDIVKCCLKNISSMTRFKIQSGVTRHDPQEQYS